MCVFGDGRTWSRGQGVGSAEHATASLYGVQTQPNHGNDGAGSHVIDQAWEEGFTLKISVV